MNWVSFLALALACLAQIHAKDPIVAESNINSNIIDDKKVEELLIKENIDNDLQEFVQRHIKEHKLVITEDEVFNIILKIRNRDLLDKKAMQTNVKKLIEIGNIFKRKLEGCAPTKGKTVDSFVTLDLMNDVKKRLLLVNDGFQCPDATTDVASDGKSSPKSSLKWDYMEKIKKKLEKNPTLVLKDLTEYMRSSGFLSEETLPLVSVIGMEVLKSQETVDYLIYSIDQLEVYARSDSGQRMLTMFPQLLTATPEEALQLFSREADYNQEAFFSLMKNTDIADSFMKSVAKLLITLFQWGKTALDDNLKFAVVNGMLISNNFPPLNKKHLLKSTCGIIDKGLKLFTTANFKTNLYEQVKIVSDDFEKQYFKFQDFPKLSEDELVNVLTQFMNDNVLEQIKDSYLVNKHVTMINRDCAEMATCLYNQNYRNSNIMVKTIVKGMSVVMGYSWTSMFPDMDWDSVYSSIFVGLDENNCKEFYSTAPKDCDVFTNKRQQLGMNLNFEHNEL